MEVFYYLTATAMCLAYAASSFFYWRFFISENQGSAAAVRSSLFVALFFHSLFLLELGMVNSRCPLATPGEALLFCGLILCISQLISEFFSKTIHLGIFTVIPTSLSVWFSLFLVSAAPISPEKNLGSLFSFHIVASLTSYACFTIGAIISTMYIILFRKLKAKNFDVVFRRLPPLDKMESLMAIWISLGIILMVVSGFIGWASAHKANSQGGMSAMEMGVFGILFFFSAIVLVRKFGKLRSARFAYAVISGFFIMLATQFLGHGFQ